MTLTTRQSSAMVEDFGSLAPVLRTAVLLGAFHAVADQRVERDERQQLGLAVLACQLDPADLVPADVALPLRSQVTSPNSGSMILRVHAQLVAERQGVRRPLAAEVVAPLPADPPGPRHRVGLPPLVLVPAAHAEDLVAPPRHCIDRPQRT
jgi:hypothetical protein